MEVGSRGAAVLGSSFLVLSWPQAHSPLKLELVTRTAASGGPYRSVFIFFHPAHLC